MDATLPGGLLEALVGDAAGGAAMTLAQTRVSALAGGFVSRSVRRIDLDLTAADGQPRTRSYVLKACTGQEASVMAAVAEQGAASFPAVVAVGPGWFVAPFYEGGDLTFGDPAPLAVARDLAVLHAAWETRPPPPGVWTYDAAREEALRVNALTALPDAAARARLDGLGPSLATLADHLPRTLVHGDVHPGNLIAVPDGRFILIDWGNASVAPGMLDVANMIPLHSPGWVAYLAAYRAAGGAQSDAALILAWHWARGLHGLMYLPWVCQRRPTAAASLIAQTLEAEAALAATGDAPLG